MGNISGEWSFQLQSNLDFVALHEKLHWKHGPTVQPKEIAGILANIDKDLEDCDAEISHLQAHIIVLHNQQWLLEEYKSLMHPFNSSIWRLPNEIILLIFHYACTVNELGSKKVETMPALVISSVCSHWWILTKNCPALWSSICIRLQSAAPKNLSLPILDLYLRSSHQSPLTLKLTGEVLKTFELHQLTIFAALTAHANHWKSITVWQAQVYWSLMDESHWHFPMLETLELSEIRVCTADLDYFQHAPKIYRLSLGESALVDLYQMEFPWRKLTNLDCIQHPEGMQELIEMCDGLMEHRLHEFDWVTPNQCCVPPAIVSSLQTMLLLVVHTTYPDDQSLTEVVFASMPCPSLTSLSLEGPDIEGPYWCPWPKASLHGFISWSSFQLTILSIKYIPLSDLDLINLQCLPSLLSLTINDSRSSCTNDTATNPSPITSWLMQSFHAFPCTISASSSLALIQRLQTLNVTSNNPMAFDDLEFIEMVTSRWLPSHSKVLALELKLLTCKSFRFWCWNRVFAFSRSICEMHTEYTSPNF